MKITKYNTYLLGLIAGLSGVYFYFKPEFYLTANLDFWLALLTAPFIIKTINNAPSWRLLPIVLLGLGTLVFLKSNALYYFTFVFSVLFLLENTRGKLNPLTFFIVFISSAFFRVITNLWSFPIRLKLSEWAGMTLQLMGIDAQVVGNVIYLNGDKFSVDPACMGLSMTVTALIIALLMLTFIEKKREHYWTFAAVTFLMGLTLLFSVAANFIRLLVLILFRIMPENPLHDVMGMASLALYVLVPFYFLSLWISTRFPKLMHPLALESTEKKILLEKKEEVNKRRFFKIGQLLLPVLFALTGVQFLNDTENQTTDFSTIKLPDFQKSITEQGILQLRNDSLLIYIKPPSPIYRSTHDPRICWKGSGYQFSDIQQVEQQGVMIYTAQLTTKQDTLYTAWWFDNGKQQTIREWEWRWKSLGTEQGYYLINISAEGEEVLEKAVDNLLKQSLLDFMNEVE